MKQKILIAMTGASGAPYTAALLRFLLADPNLKLSFIYSAAAQIVAKQELGWELSSDLPASKKFLQTYFQADLTNLELVGNHNWFNAAASGSNAAAKMVICPASMGTVAAIAHGISDDLIARAADVCLKERKKLLLIPRESPFSTLHLENLTSLSSLGAVIMPAAPGFYNQPQNIDDLINFVVAVILRHLELEYLINYPRWGE